MMMGTMSTPWPYSECSPADLPILHLPHLGEHLPTFLVAQRPDGERTLTTMEA